MAQQFRSQLIYEAIGKGELLEYGESSRKNWRISAELPQKNNVRDISHVAINDR